MPEAEVSLFANMLKINGGAKQQKTKTALTGRNVSKRKERL